MNIFCRVFLLALCVAGGLRSAWGQTPPSHRAQAAGRIPVILDSDINADIDDTWDLALVLKSPRLELKLITTTSFNAVERARLLAKLLTVAGRSDVPIGLGDQKVTFPRGGSQSAWLNGYQLSDYRGKVYQDGVQAMIDTIRRSPVPVTIIANGPFQTIAAALQRDPGIAPKVNLVGMMGSIAHPTIRVEGDIEADIPAAQAVFKAPWRSVAFAPADTANFIYIDGANYQRLTHSSDPLVKALIECSTAYIEFDRMGRHKNTPIPPVAAPECLWGNEGVYLADPQNRSLVSLVRLPIEVTGDGRTAISIMNGKEMDVALTFKDREAFERHLVDVLLSPTVPADLSPGGR